MTFSISGYVIGGASAADIITTNTLSADTTTAINIAQILQTVDSDKDHTNGISTPQLGPQFDVMGTMTVAVDTPTFDDATVGTILTRRSSTRPPHSPIWIPLSAH